VVSTKRVDRRLFLRQSALGAVAVGGLSACDRDEVPVAAAEPAHGASSASTQAAALAAKGEEIDRMHEAGIKAFPAKTEGTGCQPIAPRMDAGVKVYELTATEMRWEVAPGQRVPAMAYNGQVPGPEIRVREGDRVRVVLTNRMNESTSIHFHGLELPNDQDGVPFITKPPVKPGETYTYEFTVPNAGSHMYHSHHNSTKQVGLGLLGAFIVEPRNPRSIERVDREFTLILNDGMHGYTVNGKGFPATAPLVAKLGEKIRIRYMNEGMMIHPMHLHGMHMTVIDKDGWPQPAPWKCDTLNVAPGERWDVIVNCTMPGTWAFHCHILPHAESEHGMFGMVTVLVVEK
jgi:FtsP/CotA-like multicopper oxidase with cupredoxin domain